MTNINLEELRSKLRTVHESQGVSKSTAMKLMQEIDEVNAKWRKEWGRANKLQEKLDAIQLVLGANSFEEYYWGGQAVMVHDIKLILDKDKDKDKDNE